MLMLQVIDNKTALAAEISAWKKAGMKIGFVPTMGALHEGHLVLVKRAREENDRVVVSIFVNPTQFNNPEDLKNYPRTLDSDVKQLEAAGPDLIFAPTVNEMYPEGRIPEVPDINLGSLDHVMEASHRPGHFKGVMQVVAQLFRLVQPDKAYFGEKDYQQLAVIRSMSRQLDLPVTIVGCPTVREPDGLAMSSRNMLLSPEERKEAALISRALFYVRDNWNSYSVDELIHKATSMIEKNGRMKVEYVSIADSITLEPVSNWKESSSVRVCTAVRLGKVRLIDNVGLTTGED